MALGIVILRGGSYESLEVVEEVGGAPTQVALSTLSVPTSSAMSTSTETPAAAAETAAPEPTPVQQVTPPGGEEVVVWVTFYSCPPYCNHPAGPLPLAEGQAACDRAYMGWRFWLNGREYVCNDTGSAVRGPHVDLFFWEEAVGWQYLKTYGTTGRLIWLK